eukprot:522794-Rhodomonas_salina.4
MRLQNDTLHKTRQTLTLARAGATTTTRSRSGRARSRPCSPLLAASSRNRTSPNCVASAPTAGSQPKP